MEKPVLSGGIYVRGKPSRKELRFKRSLKALYCGDNLFNRSGSILNKIRKFTLAHKRDISPVHEGNLGRSGPPLLQSVTLAMLCYLISSAGRCLSEQSGGGDTAIVAWLRRYRQLAMGLITLSPPRSAVT
ncbi:unnamed protein product [Pleuronectes platessa]|uniref:Uncharacterized protein n=1 Tax=Pleuronectes platessa TaxID=8262 RepID=A0A9N7ZCN0_PLEPL|nr:unnamed protein product [Pleuronectes platessa]